jgi:hypothetical protein
MTSAEAGRIPEDDACRLEDHLQACSACRAARGRLAAVATLLRDPPPVESRSGSVERAIARALAGERPVAARAPSPTGRRAALVAAALVGAVASGWWLGGPDRTPSAAIVRGLVEADGVALPPGGAAPLHEDLLARSAATLRLGDVSLRLAAGSRVALDGAGTVRLRAGRAHLVVRQGTPFAVRTGRFVARVRGTRFVLTSAWVEVSEGRVEVSSPDGVLLASLGPGGRWSAPAEPRVVARAPAPVTPTELPRDSAASVAPAAPSRPAPARRVEPAAAGSIEPEPTLADVRTALRARETARARTLLDRLARSPGVSRAEVDMLRADSLRLERRFAEAVREYHAIAGRYRGSAAGEAALFTAAQLELDRLGRAGDARRSLDEYHRRHPNGRFHAEVERLRAQLGPRPEESR